MAELDECIGEFMWGSMVFYRQWGVQARDLLLRPPEWCAATLVPCLLTTWKGTGEVSFGDLSGPARAAVALVRCHPATSLLTMG